MTDPLLVIFDVDGTLVDSQNSIVQSMTDAFAEVDKPVPERAELLSIVGLSLPQAFAVLAPWADETQNAVLVEAYKASYVRNRAGGKDGSVLYPGAYDTLANLAKLDDVVLGVATGKSKRGLDILIDAHGLHGFFHTIQVADFHPSKPHPSMVLQAMADVGLGADRTIMIGDTSFDMEMARSAGCHALGVAWGYHSMDRLHAGGAAAVLDSFADLSGHLNLFRRGA